MTENGHAERGNNSGYNNKNQGQKRRFNMQRNQQNRSQQKGRRPASPARKAPVLDVANEPMPEINPDAPVISITELKRAPMTVLNEMAERFDIPDYSGMKRQDLIFHILQTALNQNNAAFGEGTIEILPDGFGFLRSPDASYLPGPDDIYISPSQIRRFG
ncbi:MAG TPA: Rho termination factor N-terminal domain-containing protein, partial [Candidatus Hydrogenedentes bacterium]|nr:Rho termination factor N-terminal domain-containing protein [Candidatus Hydrogenedentota bacterium]